MRELTKYEVNFISGGTYYADKEGLKNILFAAAKDGFAVATIISPTLGAAVYTALTHVLYNPSTHIYSSSLPLVLGVGVGLASAPVLGIAGFCYSSALVF